MIKEERKYTHVVIQILVYKIITVMVIRYLILVSVVTFTVCIYSTCYWSPQATTCYRVPTKLFSFSSLY